MAYDFNKTTYTGTQIGQGEIVHKHYTGQSETAVPGLSVSLSGTISKAGDMVTATFYEYGHEIGSYPVTYEGYFVGTNHADVFVFGGVKIPHFGTLVFTVSSQNNAYGVDFGQKLDSGTPAQVCFLAGTRIATASGERTVESLAIGDLVATRAGAETVMRPVTWIGRHTCRLDGVNASTDDFPVRIRAGAFADSVPSRDLLVTSEHCILVDGRFIPVRMLVNGASIVAETGITTFEYFHIETETHSVLVAEGLETESYLDTGNRHRFANADVASLRPGAAPLPDARRWNGDAAAPLATSLDIVQPVWERLATRAAEIGFALPVRLRSDRDAAIRLVTNAGLELRPFHVEGSRHDFVVPAGTQTLRLLSRTARPSEVVGPYVDDRRSLGVKVGRVALALGARGGDRAVEHLDAGLLDGWHAVEPGEVARWTDGDAVLPLDVGSVATMPAVLSIEIHDAMAARGEVLRAA